MRRLVLTALLKPILPEHTGVWFDGSGHFMSSGVQFPPPGSSAHEVLGFWYIPLALAAGSLALLATTWTIRASLQNIATLAGESLARTLESAGPALACMRTHSRCYSSCVPIFFPGFDLLLGFRTFFGAVLLVPLAVHATGRVEAAPVPAEMRSTAFTVKVNGHPVDVAHAAASYEFVSFDITGPVTVEITAIQAGFWDKGVDIQPWRLGLRPARHGATIRFRLAAPAKLSISRPGDFLNHAAMLFLFAGSPPPPLPTDAQCACGAARACTARA